MIAQGSVVKDQRGITARWLTSTLRANGTITDAKVRTLNVAPFQTKALSDLYLLQVTHSQEIDAPGSYILKVACKGQASPTARRRRWKEHEFYATVAPVMIDPPVPKPYASVYDAVAQRSHLLLADMTKTHWHPPAPLPPTPEQLRGAVDCLAEIHAHWWGHPDLHMVTSERNAQWIEARAKGINDRLNRFLAEFDRHLPRSMVIALGAVAAAWPGILIRTAEMSLTVVHGDAHPWNFLTPNDGDAGRVCLLDWEGWSIEPGPHDLASLIALHLPVSERRAIEDELLERYATRLNDGGVVDYAAGSCRDDYRRAIARRVLSPVGLWSQGAHARTWWPALEHITQAYHNLRCEDVLESGHANVEPAGSSTLAILSPHMSNGLE